MSNNKNKIEREEAVRDERYARLTKIGAEKESANFFATAWHGVKTAFSGLDHVRKGLETVAMHTWREPTTEAYPDKAPELPPHFRGRLALTVNPDTGENLCISCRQCERVCPDKCIEITASKSTETNKLELIDFKIDHGLCMFCGLCTEVCPTYCIINTNDFEMADYTRESLIYDLKKLTLTQEESAYYFAAKEMPLPKPKPVKAAVPAGGAAAKPAGAAAPATAGTTSAPAAATPAAKLVAPISTEKKVESGEAKTVEPAKVELPKAELPETETPKIEPAKIEPKELPKIEPGVEPKIEPKETPKIEPGVEPRIEPGIEPKIEPGAQPTIEAKTKTATDENKDKPGESPAGN
jgi:NADH-quinone oxidoreductase subunit I